MTIEGFLDSGKVSANGQVTIPKDVRDRFGIKGGDRILFVERNGQLTIIKA